MMWSLAFGMTVAAGAAATALVPSVRKIAFGSVKHDWLCHELEFDHIDPDQQTVVTKSGLCFQVIEIAGQSYETKPEAIQISMHAGRSAAFLQIGEKGVAYRIFGVKRLHDVSKISKWPSVTLEEIGNTETNLYKNSYTIKWFMVLSHKKYETLREASDIILSSFSNYQPQILSQPEEGPCRLSGFLNYLLCGEDRNDLQSFSRNISANLPQSDLGFEVSGRITTLTPDINYTRIIAIRKWSEIASGDILRDLMMLDGEIEVFQACIPIKKAAALVGLGRKDNEEANGSLLHKFAFGNKEIDAAAELLVKSEGTWAETQFQIALRAPTEEKLSSLIREVCDLLATRRIIYSVESKGAAVCWFNRIPERDKLLRPLKLFNYNISALWPFQFSPVGLWQNPWGDGPVRLFRTGTGQAYAFQYHVSDRDQSLGHYLIFAPAGSGKTSIAMHLTGGLTRFKGVRSYVFDSKEGTRYTIEALGGTYQSYNTLSLNPLDTYDNELSRERLGLLIQAMMPEIVGMKNADSIINHIISVAFNIDIKDRTFNSIFNTSFARGSDERRIFGSRWVTDRDGRVGRYAKIFNADRDCLAGFLGQSSIVGINMNEALADPVLAPPVVMHICSTISEIASRNSVGFHIFIDEAANLLRNEKFAENAEEMFREYRKLNGVVGMAFQDPRGLFASKVSEAILTNTATKIFFPNASGNPQSYENFNLNEEEKEFIFNSPADGRRRVLVIKEEASAGFRESVILDVDLSRFGNAMRFYRSGPDAVSDLLSIQERWGDQWLHHV